MKNPTECFHIIKQQVRPQMRTAFFSALIIGLLVHLPVILSDIPNHDGLASMYFDQNMITSGRWFLMIACGFSSYFTLPWLIGLLAVLFLALTSVCLTQFLELHKTYVIILVSGLLVSFPAAASSFAYVFTMDGYMLGLLLAVLAVLLTKEYRFGFVGGAVCLAFSLGTYQAYLPFAVLLSVYGILMIAMEPGGEGKYSLKGKIKRGLNYLYMGVLGSSLYYIVLHVLLKVQGKVLDDYQGINGMAAPGSDGLLSSVKSMYLDFIAFAGKGNVLFNNHISFAAFLLLLCISLSTLAGMFFKREWWKNVWFWLLSAAVCGGLPVATNLILVISPDVTYHLLMRYQWVLFPILLTAFISRYGCEETGASGSLTSWALLVSAAVMVFNYAVTDNIAYSNLQKRYEKTYAYCIRLLDRIEQTDGYYQGIPVAMIGVVGDEEYPLTDITGSVTDNMIGMNGDSLLYKGDNYEAFIRHYLGATLNILPADAMAEMYYSEEYRAMESFPGRTSIKIIDGIMYVKTENIDKNPVVEGK